MRISALMSGYPFILSGLVLVGRAVWRPESFRFFKCSAAPRVPPPDARLFDTDVGDASTNFMLQPGAGVNLKMTETLGLVGQVDYRRVFVEDGEDAASGANQFRVLSVPASASDLSRGIRSPWPRVSQLSVTVD